MSRCEPGAVVLEREDVLAARGRRVEPADPDVPSKRIAIGPYLDGAAITGHGAPYDGHAAASRGQRLRACARARHRAPPPPDRRPGRAYAGSSRPRRA